MNIKRRFVNNDTILNWKQEYKNNVYLLDIQDTMIEYTLNNDNLNDGSYKKKMKMHHWNRDWSKLFQDENRFLNFKYYLFICTDELSMCSFHHCDVN